MEKMQHPAVRPITHLLRRIRTFAAAACAGVAAFGADAQWTTPPVSAPGVEYRTFSSAAAGTTVSYHIYLPPAYAAQPAARFPVLYWLHGSGGPTQGIAQVAGYFASGMAQGRIPPMLVVIPNGMSYSMWCDSKDGLVPMETVVIDDLIPHIDATFRTFQAWRDRLTRPAPGPGGLRRPEHLKRPWVAITREAYRSPVRGGA